MLGVSSLTPARARRNRFSTFAFAVESREEAHAIQTFLWCLWFVALKQTYNGRGLLCSVNYSGTGGTANATTSKTTTYDQYSRPVATTTLIAGLTFVSRVAYDGLG